MEKRACKICGDSYETSDDDLVMNKLCKGCIEEIIRELEDFGFLDDSLDESMKINTPIETIERDEPGYDLWQDLEV